MCRIRIGIHVGIHIRIRIRIRVRGERSREPNRTSEKTIIYLNCGSSLHKMKEMDKAYGLADTLFNEFASRSAENSNRNFMCIEMQMIIACIESLQ